MPATWPIGVPDKIIESSGSFAEGETAIRSPTDSGLARQRAAFTAALDQIGGNIRMTLVDYETFRDWRKALGGSTFTWAGHPSGPVEARFVAGAGSTITKDPKAAGKWLVPVKIEVMP